MFYAPHINVETEPKKDDGENWTKKFGKLNWRKICVSSFLSAEGSACKNVLSVAMH